jgi:hypothetical protein
MMHCRRHGSRPTLALWMLVIAANVATVLTGVGVLTALVVVGALGLVAAGATVIWLLARRTSTRPATPPVTRSLTRPVVARHQA